MARRVLLSWSSGKDSAWTLHVLHRQPDVQVVGLLTTFNEAVNRVAMHAVRRHLVEVQAAAADLPLWPVPLPWPCSNDDYERRMTVALRQAEGNGVTHVAFGDLFLEDVRDYRARQFEDSTLEPLFPIWHEPTAPLARRMINAGIKAVITCVDSKKLPRSYAGRLFNHALLEELPEDIDPCGENGEFHTCVLAGPMFRERLRVTPGEIVERDGFYFADLVPDAPVSCRS